MVYDTKKDGCDENVFTDRGLSESGEGCGRSVSKFERIVGGYHRRGMNYH